MERRIPARPLRPARTSAARRWLAALALLAAPAQAQDDAARADSTRALGEVEVGASAERPGVARVPVAGVLARDPVTLADVARLVPSAIAPTNSRGETLLYLRGAGERQTAVLLDGAPLTVPWDRRVDLALVPAGVVGSVDVVRGPASLVWGPNAAGGALDLVPRELHADGALAEAEASGGLPARGRLAATHLRQRGRWRTSVAVDASASEGDALAGALPFSQPPGALRTNTDRRALGALARAVYRAGPEVSVAATLLHLRATQGVAPEGHLDPARDRVRYWRLPDGHHSTLVLRAQAPAGPVRLDATAWGGLAGQTVVRYENAAYDAVDAEQVDCDRTLGGRLVTAVGGPAGSLRAIAWGLVSAHDQREDGAVERFREAEWRLGVEGETLAGPARLLLGVALDGFAPIETAGRPAADRFQAVGLVARAEAPVTSAVHAHVGVSHAGRFPSMRELFGEALGRFALNPDLGPERTWQAEAGARVDGRRVAGRAAVFARQTAGTLEQEALPDGRRRRVNLGGSRALGVEAEASVRATPTLRVDASGTLLHLRAFTDTERGLRLTERPGALGRLAITHLPPRGWTWAAEAVTTGPAVSLDPNGLVDLPASLRLGVRVGYRWPVGRGLLGAFVRIDNATDAVHLPQAGLPAPGREVRAGLRWIR